MLSFLIACVAEESSLQFDSALDWGPELPALLPPPDPIELVAVPADVLPGTTLELVVTGASVGETVVFALSDETGVGPCPKKLGGLCLDLVAPLKPVASVVADAAGVVAAKWTVPDRPGQTVCFQAAIKRGVLGVDSVKTASSCLLIGSDLDPDDCGLGVCVDGAYMEGGDCPFPVGYPPDALISLLVCGGVLDPCCGLGSCTGGSYVDDCLAYASTDPLSLVVCGGAYEDGNGVGSCFGGSWCDDWACYIPGGTVSELFCDCQDGPEVTLGCGPIDCATYCDDCVCYSPGAPEVLASCPGGTGAFKRYFTGANYAHLTAGALTYDGWITAGWSGSGAWTNRLDGDGNVLWSRKDAGFTWWDVSTSGAEHTLAGQDAVASIDDAGALLWWADLPGTGTIAEAVTTAANGDRVALAIAGLDLYFARWDTNGVPLWAFTLGGPGNEAALDVIELASGDLLLMAATDSWGAGLADLLFVRTTSSGSVVWAEVIGGPLDESDWPQRSHMSHTSDGKVAWATSSYSFSWGAKDAFYGKLDPDTGALDWAWNVGWTGDETASNLAERPDGNFWLIGEEFTDYNGFFVMDVTATGVPLSGYSWGEDPYQNYVDGGVAPDGSPWIASETHHHPVGPLQHLFYVMKGDPDGKMDSCCEVEPLLSAYGSGAFPSVAPVTPVTAVAALSTSLAPVDVYGALTPHTLCDVDHDYVCGGPVTSDCLCD